MDNTRTLTINLPANTVYVSGTVNGIATTWTNTSGITWETVADRSPIDEYVVDLTIINTAGLSTHTIFTLYYGLQLITDRTQADVDYSNALLEKLINGTISTGELIEWNNATLKGSYNYTDLNRVGSAMIFVADKLNEYGFNVTISPKNVWTEDDDITPENMAHYLQQLSILRETIPVGADTPEVPDDMVQLTYTEANNIEKILEDLDHLINSIALSWFYSGDLYSGEV